MSKINRSVSAAAAVGFTVGIILALGGLLSLFTEPGAALLLMLGGGLIGWLSWLGLRSTGPSQTSRTQSAKTPDDDATSWSARYLPRPDEPEPSWRGTTEVGKAFEVKPARRQYKAPAPQGAPFEAWGSGEEGVEVVGEFAVPASFRQIFRNDRQMRSERGMETNDPALLVADPLNPYDNRAVAVFVHHQHVGYIPRELAAYYHSVVMGLQEQGHQLQVRARTWAAIRKRNTGTSRVVARVRVYLPTEDQLYPDNGLPEEPHVPVPRGSKVQVTGEEQHMDVLGPFLRQHGRAPVAVVLRSIVEQRPRSQVELVQADLSGARVGVLSKGQSEKLMPLVRGVEQRGLLPVVRGEMRGDQTKVDVTLDVLREADEVSAWLGTLGMGVSEKGSKQASADGTQS